MRYKAIAAVVGGTALLAMALMAAEKSGPNSYSIDRASSTVTQGPDQSTMASESFAPADKATPPCGFTSSC